MVDKIIYDPVGQFGPGQPIRSVQVLLRLDQMSCHNTSFYVFICSNRPSGALDVLGTPARTLPATHKHAFPHEELFSFRDRTPVRSYAKLEIGCKLLNKSFPPNRF